MNRYLNPYGAKKLQELLDFIYEDKASYVVSLLNKVFEKRLDMLKDRIKNIDTKRQLFTEKDALLITYGDMISSEDDSFDSSSETALCRLERFIDKYLSKVFSYIHILPFYPYSSDDGFSVMDYWAVNPLLGTWHDIDRLSKKYRLAFDLVLNHASAKGQWFLSFLKEEKPYNNYFITRPMNYDYSTVLRPRTQPLISEFTMYNGKKIGVWTTFSKDQVDIDFSCPEVFAEFTEIILAYYIKGARLLRLDAIAYLWKEDGTSCAHLPKTHAVVKAIRAIIDGLGLDMVLLTETNVSHEENISYFGSEDEAHMVYNFSLPPLVLNAFVREDVKPLSKWAKSLNLKKENIMLNFLASHDGVGIMPVKSLVDDFDVTINLLKERGCLVSNKSTKDGDVPYELNISWADAVAKIDAQDDEKAKALTASYAIACSMQGVPAIYFHSIVGSVSWITGVRTLGYNRAINRQKPRISELENDLQNKDSLRYKALTCMSSLLEQRAKHKAFSPYSPCKILSDDGCVFALVRGEQSEEIIVVVNCSNRKAKFILPDFWNNYSVLKALNPTNNEQKTVSKELELDGYEVLWISHE